MKFKSIIAALAATLTLAVGCVKEADHYLSDIQVSSSYVAIPAEGGSQTVAVTSSASWKVSSELEWLTISPDSGSAGETAVKFSAEAATETREGSVYILCGEQTQIINIIQQTEKTELPISTVEEINAAADGKSFRAKGTCTAISNTYYGNWYLEDETGSLYIYGTVDATGAYNWESFDISVGDVVTVEGAKTTYSGTVELVDVVVIAVEKSLIKVTEAPAEDLAKEGEDFEIKLECKGEGVSCVIPDDAKDWLTITGITTGSEAVASFTAAANEGGDRSATLTFTTTSGGKTYTAQATVKQLGAIIECSIAEFCEAPVGETQYKLTGVITEVVKAQYGNIYIKDWSGDVYVYGVGSQGDFETLGLKVGDIVTLQGTRGEWGETIEMLSAQYISHIEVNELAIADFIVAPDSSDDYYMVTGTVKEIVNETYGNVYLTDGTNDLYVYGVYPGYGATGDDRKNFLATAGIEVGDELTMIGYKTTWDSVVELCGGIYFSHEKGVSGPKFGVEKTSITVENTATTATIGVTGDVEWKVTCPDGSGLTADPESGTGAAEVVVTLPANETADPVEYVVKISTEAEVDVKEIEVTIKHQGKDISYSTIAELCALATSTEEPFELYVKDALITYVNGNNAFIEDETAGVQLYQSGHTLTAGNKITGKISGKIKLYQNFAEMTSLDVTAATLTEASVTPTVATIAEMLADYGKYINKYIKVEGVTVTKTCKGSSALSERQGNMKQGESEMMLYAQIKQDLEVPEGWVGDVVGVPTQYGTTYEFGLWSQDDFTKTGQATVNGKITMPETKTIKVGENFELGATVNSGATISYSSDNEAVATVDQTGKVTAVAEGTATITASAPAVEGFTAAEATCVVTVEGDANPNIVFEESFEGNSWKTAGSDGSTKLTSDDLPNFTDLNNIYWARPELGGVKFGTGSKTGAMTAKDLDLSKGAFTIKFTAGSYSTSEGAFKVTCGDVVKEYDLTNSGADNKVMTEYTIDCEASTATTVTFETTSKRAYLNHIIIEYK